MNSGAMFGLKAAMDQSKSVSKLITSAANQTMNSAGNKPNSSEAVLQDFASQVNKKNEMILDMAKANYEAGSNLDIYA